MRCFCDGRLGLPFPYTALLFLLCSFTFIQNVHAQGMSSDAVETGCRCNSAIMDILSIKAAEHGIDILRLSFNRDNCGTYPRCGGYCDFQFDGKTISLDIPCEPFSRSLEGFGNEEAERYEQNM